ncbi:unnamed protein product [Dracunculus medinensis]|uniref:ACR domain-containing protein n=1 Tax=Dracunculus medinensis TaxID=318479 RepID=A0A0N4UHA6_DRAME|nr:unnamed protein product [Dracunculus medinensis]
MDEIQERTRDRTIQAVTYEKLDGYGCRWIGYAPFCSNVHVCPSGYDTIRSHNGRCSKRLFAGKCIPDHSFGSPCMNFFGADLVKTLCCISKPGPCTWNGHWMAGKMGHNIYCKHHKRDFECGEVTCLTYNSKQQANDTHEVHDISCDKTKLFNHTGILLCGTISWFNDNDEIVDIWYKFS